jgi:hypothetical protein
MRTAPLALLLTFVVVSPTLADKVLKKDGTAINGTIVSETATTVVIQVTRGGAIMKYPIERTAIASVERTPAVTATRPATQPATKPAETAPAGPGYYPLPVIGEIGTDVTAATLREALGHARRATPAVVVLVFDTERGSLDEARQMLDVLRQQPKDLRVVAHVRKALSVGAIVAIGCREIYVAPDALVGASAVEEITARTVARLAAEQGGHPALVAKGMFDPDVELLLGKDDGKPHVFEQSDATTDRNAKPFKTKGRLLTLSGADAVACGLAKGTLDSLDNLSTALGTEPLHKMASPGWYLIERKGRAARDEMARRAFIAERRKAYDAYMEKVQPQLDEIDARLEQIKPELRAEQDTLRDLDNQWADENRAIESEYRDASRIDARVTPDRRARLLDNANARREQKLVAARERFQPELLEHRERVNELTREQQALTKKRKALAEAAPKVPK